MHANSQPNLKIGVAMPVNGIYSNTFINKQQFIFIFSHCGDKDSHSV